MILFESQTILIALDSAVPCIEWISKTSFTNSEEFRQSVLRTIEAYKKQKKSYDQLGYFVDSTNTGVIKAADTDWAAQEIIENLLPIGLQKQAFVVPKSIFGELSIKNYEQKIKEGALTIKYFSDQQQAKEWLKS